MTNQGAELSLILKTTFVMQIFFEEHRKSNQSSGKTPSRPQPLDNYEKAERVWERLLSAHEFGDSLITVATGEEFFPFFFSCFTLWLIF